MESLDVHHIDWVVVYAYFDETVGGQNDELTAVAGYLFDRAGVERFLQIYRETIEPLLPPDKHGVKMFHAAPCFDGDDPYFGIARPIRECILARMATAISKSVTVGVVVGIDQKEYGAGLLGSAVQINGKRPDSLEPWVGSKYSLCLLRCIHGLNDWMNGHNIDGPVEYVMESGNPKEDEAHRLLSRLNLSPLRGSLRMGNYGFRPKGPENPWLFAADYFAWVWQKNDRPILPNDVGDWQAPVRPMLESALHLGVDLTEQSVNTQAIVNAFNGLMYPVGLRVKVHSPSAERL